MDPIRRKSYLKALGVDVWIERRAAAKVVHAGVAIAAPEARVPVTAAEPAELARTARVARGPISKDLVADRIEPSPVVAVLAPPYQAPADWDGLRAAVRDCQRCKLCATRTQTVFGVGPEPGPGSAPLMIVGEAPGADEDAQGEPFVGRAGKLLDEMLRAIGCSRRDNVFIANVVKCRPPANRDPQTDEVDACRPYLEQQIQLIRPKLIVGLGLVAARRLLATDAPLARLRGPLHRYGEANTPLFITYHPAYLLRSPREKAKSWEDLKKIWRLLQGTGLQAGDGAAIGGSSASDDGRGIR